MRIKKRCNLCDERVYFQSIETQLGDVLNKKGFPYKLNDFETLNYKEYSCPNCGASDRERLYKLYLDQFPFSKGGALIDFAPAPALQSYLKSFDVQYRSADLFMEGVDDKVDITDMKIYEDESIDFFVCSHLLEHVDDKKALSELWRILRYGGKGILMTPIIKSESAFDEDLKLDDIEERWRRFAQDDHVRLYSKSEFLKRVRDAKFRIREYTAKDFGFFTLIFHGISLKSVLYIVEKYND